MIDLIQSFTLSQASVKGNVFFFSIQSLVKVITIASSVTTTEFVSNSETTNFTLALMSLFAISNNV